MAGELDKQFEHAKRWREEALALRKVLLACGLKEERKWAKPCYVHDGDNICIIQRMNDFLALMFFKGALLDNPNKLLKAQGPNSRSAMRVTFTDVKDVTKHAAAIRALVKSAIAVENAGIEVKKPAPPKPPAELAAAFKRDAELKAAFNALTPGRRRGYILHFEGAKQPKTRAVRIEKARDKIIAGKGFNER